MFKPIYTPLNVKLYNKETFLELETDLKLNREFLKACLATNGLLYELIPVELKIEREIILIAFENDESVYDLIPISFKKDLDFYIELIKLHPLVIDKFPEEFRNNKSIILQVISDIGVDALWHKKAEVFQDVEIIISALKSPYGQDCWTPILISAGDNAEFFKNMIEVSYQIMGDSVIEYDWEWILTQSNIREAFSSSFPDLAKKYL